MFYILVYLLVATKYKTISIPTILDKTDGKFRLPPPTKSRTENGVFCPSRSFRGAKKVMSDSIGLVDFAIGQGILFLSCPTGK